MRETVAKQQNILEGITKISDIVTAARDLVKDGQIIDVQPLEQEVEDLCAMLAGVDAQTAREVQPILLGLMEELNHLAQTMDDRHSQLSDELRSLAAHGNAASAYSVPPSGSKKLS